ncbi:MAG: FAD:protein FMN transferase [FCB group bacterium]|nr:FAD:protein FMN transferase [FCB group bacterium]
MKQALLIAVLAASFVSSGVFAAEEGGKPIVGDVKSSPSVSVTTPATGTQQTFRHEAMGTFFEFTLFAREGETGTDEIGRIARQAFDAVDDLEARISNWIPDSQISYVNNHAAEGPVSVAPDVLELISFSKKMYQESHGAFDVTVGPLIALWGFYKGKGHLPEETELREALSKVGMDKVYCDPLTNTVAFAKPGIRLDFGGIGKGMALDVAARILRDNGVTAAVLHGGSSSVYALGTPPGETGWTVRIRNPYNGAEWLDEVKLSDVSLSTSGSYDKFFDLEGKKYCHIFDPRTGKPVEGMLSATSIAPTGIESDALSTAFFVMGREKTEAYCREHPGIRAILVPVPADGEPKPARVNFSVGKE